MIKGGGMNFTSSRSQGLTYVITGMFFMSLDPVFIRLSGASGWNTAFLFGLFSFVSMSLLTQYREKGGIKKALMEGGAPIFISGLIMGGSGTTLVLSVKHTLVANTMLIMSTTSIFSAVFSRLLLKEKTPLRTWAASLISIIGIYVIAKDSLGRGDLFGDMMAVVCTGFASLNYVMWRKYKNMSRTMSVALGGFAIAFFSSFMSSPTSLPVRTWLVMLVMGMISAPMGRTLVSTSAKYIPATEISLFSLMRTVLAPFIVWLIFSEIPPENTFYGGFLILATLLILTIINYRRDAEKTGVFHRNLKLAIMKKNV